MFLYSLIKELCTKEENGKTRRNFNFGHECIFKIFRLFTLYSNVFKTECTENSIRNRQQSEPYFSLSKSCKITRNFKEIFIVHHKLEDK